jgi:hypothetical protein
MKAYRFLPITLFLAALIAVMAGCKYDVAEPQWDNPPVTTVAAKIDSIVPAQATAGVNIITIYGKNFTGALDTSVVHNATTNRDSNIVYNSVFFNGVPADIAEFTSTRLKVYRPNLVVNSCKVIVAPDKALVAGGYSYGSITSVCERVPGFASNQVLNTVSVDQTENLYIFMARIGGKQIVKVSANNVITADTISRAKTNAPTDARIGPDGNLYFFGYSSTGLGAKEIYVDNVQTGLVGGLLTLWFSYPGSTKYFKFGDFDASGYLYIGGLSSDVAIIAPGHTSSKLSGMYATASILAIRTAKVNNNEYLYIAAQAGVNTTIWKHSISAGGILGPQELVLDWSTTGQFASRTIKNIAISTDGTLFIGTDAVSNPILVLTAEGINFFYKNLLPPYCPYFGWGSGSYMYMLSGNTTASQEWTVYKVDMGMKAH